MSDLELGTLVRYSRVVRRESIRRSDGGRGEYKAWTPGPIEGEYSDPNTVRIGVVYGLRSYSNRETVWGYGSGEDYEPTTYDPQESVPVALVSWYLRRKPDAVLISDLTIMEDPYV